MNMTRACRRPGIIITCAVSAPTVITIITDDVRCLRDGRLERGNRAAYRPRQHLDLLARQRWRAAREPADPARRKNAPRELAGRGSGAPGTCTPRFRFPIRLSCGLRCTARPLGKAL